MTDQFGVCRWQDALAYWRAIRASDEKEARQKMRSTKNVDIQQKFCHNFALQKANRIAPTACRPQRIRPENDLCVCSQQWLSIKKSGEQNCHLSYYYGFLGKVSGRTLQYEFRGLLFGLMFLSTIITGAHIDDNNVPSSS